MSAAFHCPTPLSIFFQASPSPGLLVDRGHDLLVRAMVQPSLLGVRLYGDTLSAGLGTNTESLRPALDLYRSASWPASAWGVFGHGRTVKARTGKFHLIIPLGECHGPAACGRSEERRVGKECRSR